MEELKEVLSEALDFLNSLKAPAMKEAKALFPDHPKAQKIWVNLSCGDGGIMPVVNTLGLYEQYKKYKKDLSRAIKAEESERASMIIADFVNFCKEKVREDFYMFK